MQTASFEAISCPDVLLILGTDAAGKDYIGNFIAGIYEQSGYNVEKRRGRFSACATKSLSSEDKSRFQLLKEKIFLSTFSLNQSLIPLVVNFLLRWDLKAFVKPSDSKIIVVSHTAIRGLAFYLGHLYDREENIRIPRYLDTTLRSVVPITGAKTIVLDISDQVRRVRIAQRSVRGKIDHFDRYMAKGRDRAERIESFLVWIGITYLGAKKIENNDLNDEQLSEQIGQIFCDSICPCSSPGG